MDIVLILQAVLMTAQSVCLVLMCKDIYQRG